MTRQLNRRAFLGACGAAGLASRLSSAGEARRKPNIIFVFADQMRSQVLGCYGNRQVPTPHFDRLAAEGARFTNALSTWPVCSPYRAMLLTGRYPMANGTVSNDVPVRGDLPSIATVCKARGYATGYIGKWHLEAERTPFVPRERRLGFEYWASRNCSHQYFDSFYCGDTPAQVPLPGFEPEAQTQLAIDFMKAHRDHPFCLFMSWGPPHGPYHAPEAYMARFPAEKIQLRSNVPEHAFVDRLLELDPNKLSEGQARARAQFRHRIETDAALRQWISGYYAATQNLDDCMGRLLDSLKEEGLEDDTILVFSSDHGDMLGSHRMASKQLPFEEAISIPFLLRYPRAVKGGTVTDALCTPVDVMPTLLGLAGLSAPAELDGVSLADAARGVGEDPRDAVLIMKLTHGGNPWVANGIREWRGVRTKRHTYAYLLDGGPWLLFDNQNDPYQEHNLIGQEAHAALQEQLHAAMLRLMKEAGDPFDSAVIHELARQRKAGNPGVG